MMHYDKYITIFKRPLLNSVLRKGVADRPRHHGGMFALIMGAALILGGCSERAELFTNTVGAANNKLWDSVFKEEAPKKSQVKSPTFFGSSPIFLRDDVSKDKNILPQARASAGYENSVSHAPSANNPFIPVKKRANFLTFTGNDEYYGRDPDSLHFPFNNQQGVAARALNKRILQGPQYGKVDAMRDSQFNALLFEEYKRFSFYLFQKFKDELNTKYFINKAEFARMRRPVFPEDPSLWDLPAHNKYNLFSGWEELMQTMEHGGRDISPSIAAKAQVLFDCWVTEAELFRDQDTVIDCEHNFKNTLGLLQQSVEEYYQREYQVSTTFADYSYDPNLAILSPRSPAKNLFHYYQPNGDFADNLSPDLAPEQRGGVAYEERLPDENNNYIDGNQENAPPISDDAPIFEEFSYNDTGANPENTANLGGDMNNGNKFSVYFAFDSTRLDDRATRILQTLIAIYKSDEIIGILLSGYTDRAGDAAYNMNLSRRRAQVVRDYLFLHGVNDDNVRIIAHGEENLPFPTKDGVREQRNRVVLIELEQAK